MATIGNSTTSRRTTPRTTTSPPRCPTSCATCSSFSWSRRRNTTCSRSTTRSSNACVAPRPSATAGRTLFTYSGEQSGLDPSSAPSILNRSYTITADVEIPEGGGDGMIVTEGGAFGGYGLYLLKGKPVFTYNLLALERFRWEGQQALAPGKHTIVFDFKSDGPEPARAAPAF